MTTMVEPITGEELLGYISAMLTDVPWGEPAAVVRDSAPTPGELY
jgi:hypothetical protein